VALGQVGIILALEVSRLARDNAGWYRLLDLAGACALVADADGVYHPGLFNDRLLLGMKAMLSEAELHVLRSRLDGGIRNKAARGELRTREYAPATAKLAGCTAFGYGRRSATAKQLGVHAWWSLFIRITADVALTSEIPVNEHGPDGPEGLPHRGALDDRLDCRSGDPEPEQPDDGLHDDDGCRNSSN
jgi:hypothetical protein